MANAFDELLASIGDESDREALGKIAEKHPALKESVLMRSDYSRKQDELKQERETLKATVELADAWNKWREENWVTDAYGEKKGATKRELEKDHQIQALQAKSEELQKQIELGGEVTFDDLGKHLNNLIGEKKLATQDDLTKVVTEKASGVEKMVGDTLAGYAHVATKLPTLTIKHFREFSEELDGDGLVKYATDNKFTDLPKAYDAMVSERREKIRQEAVQKQIQEAELRGREAALKERGMDPAKMPDDNSGPDFGHLQRKMMGLDKPQDGGIAADVQVGQNVLAAHAAREMKGA